VDHPLSAPETLVRPWRNAALIAGAIALVELLLLLVIGGGHLARAVSSRVERAATTHANATAPPASRHVARKPIRIPAATLPRSRTKILVLNGNGRTGAAGAAASRLRRRGYEIGGVANAARHAPRSIVMYRPGFAGEGHRLAHDLGLELVGPLDGMRAGRLHGAQLVFILGG
jgi:hypothetical protein